MTAMVPKPSLRFDRLSEHIALVTLDRPQARNAISPDIALELEQIVIRTELDPAIRVVILTGAGDKAFCAGADLKLVSTGGLGSLFTAAGGFAGFVHQPRRKPWIAAVNGHALAGGCEIAMACDMIVACETATFGLPEVRRGLVAAAGGLYRLVRALPRGLALELITTGRAIDAGTALQHGLVTHVVNNEQLLPKAQALAQAIAEAAPLAVEESLQIARQAYDLSDTQLRAISEQACERLSRTEDFKEGALAFVEKRLPRWKAR